MKKHILFIVIFVNFFAVCAFADAVYLKNGNVVRGDTVRAS